MAESALSIRSLSVRIGDTSIVDDVSIDVPKGQMTVLVGPNGAGKSTLLKACLGLRDYQGDITVGRRPLGELSPVQRARAVAYVPQRSLLDTGLAVCDVVAQGRYAHGEPARISAGHADDALARVGLAGYATRSFRALSGGERRLVLIARALAAGAPMVILDEPTAWLDMANRLRVLALLQRLRDDGLTLFCVVHDIDDACAIADKAVLINAGKLVASGVVEDVLCAERIHEVYGVERVVGAGSRYRLPEGS